MSFMNYTYSSSNNLLTIQTKLLRINGVEFDIYKLLIPPRMSYTVKKYRIRTIYKL
jgi:hypothetical protein